jgi:homoaconitase/3-isopropylmalate dehydratase large subunit
MLRRGVDQADRDLGHQPGTVGRRQQRIPANADPEALAYMGFGAKTPIRGTKIDVAFIGSCTNGRISDIEEAAKIVKGHKVAKGVKALMVPGSRVVAAEAEKRRLHQIFIDAGFEWRGAGCSMCLAMNPDSSRRQVCASSSTAFQRPSGQPHRPDIADVARDGRGGGDRRRSLRRPRDVEAVPA